MPFRLTSAQRREVLRFVAKHSPDGEPLGLVEVKAPDHMAGVDLGRALLNLDIEGLCGTEEPDIVWSTPEGLKAALT